MIRKYQQTNYIHLESSELHPWIVVQVHENAGYHSNPKYWDR